MLAWASTTPFFGVAMLRIAVPNKGSLAEAASTMLKEAGYRQRRDARELVLSDPDNDTEFFFLRPRDIATYVASGQLDVGITGRDLLLDSGANATELLALGFGRSLFRYAAPPGMFATPNDLAGVRIATSYSGLVRRDLATRGLDADVVHLDGAVETAIQLGVADAIADVVATGTSLRQAGLITIGPPLLDSEAILVQAEGRTSDLAIDQLVRRLTGVVIARRYVMMEYDCPREVLDTACAITPGLESPTVTPLRDDGWVSVRAMVERPRTNLVMDELWGLGGRGILVTEIHACRL
ncbi:MAG: ATP phosphoribosyltransferase [Nitriliruptoraceae bacterium]